MEFRTQGLALSLDLSPPDQEDWRVCHATAEVPGFSGHFACWVWRSDLESFRGQLVRMVELLGLDSSARLTTTEPGIDLRLSMNSSGQIEGHYALRNFDTTGQPTLSGTFYMDQSYLPNLLAEVNKHLLTKQDSTGGA